LKKARVPVAILLSLVLLALPRGARAGDNGSLLVILGASSAAGAGAKPVSQSFASRYTAYLGEAQPSYRVVNLAVGGYNTYQMLPDGKTPSPRAHPDPEHNITKALSLHPNAILFCLSTNDVAGHFPPAEVEKNVLSIAEEAWRARVAFWIATPQPRNLDDRGRSDLAELAAWVKKQFGRTAVDFTTGLGAPDGKLLPQYDSGDGIHPNNAGHALLFQRLVESPITPR
jgi:lysophospholipase L1-like esterase